MFAQIQSWYTNRSLKKQLLTFLDEMEKNLEIYYVIDQRQFITGGFIMKEWETCKELDAVKRHEAIKVYGAALTEFNKAFTENKEYEQWYSSNMDNKIPENAKKLHALKNGLMDRVKTLEAIIIPAGQTLEKELLHLEFIAH